MQDHILSAEELELVTGKLKPAAQRRALAAMHIPFGERLDGFPLVAWSSVAAFTGAPIQNGMGQTESAEKFVMDLSALETKGRGGKPKRTT